MTKEQYNELIKEIIPQFAKPKNVEIKVRILDKDGTPVPGANVIIKGTTYGSITDFDGNAVITMPYSKNNKEVEIKL